MGRPTILIRGHSDDTECTEFTCLAAVGDTIDKVKVEFNMEQSESSLSLTVICRSDSVDYTATLYVLRNAWR